VFGGVYSEIARTHFAAFGGGARGRNLRLPHKMVFELELLQAAIWPPHPRKLFLVVAASSLKKNSPKNMAHEGS